MSNLTLFGTQGSGSAAIEAALTMAGLPFEQVEASSWQPGPGLEALARVNPLQQIPTLLLTVEQHPAVAEIFARHWPA